MSRTFGDIVNDMVENTAGIILSLLALVNILLGLAFFITWGILSQYLVYVPGGVYYFPVALFNFWGGLWLLKVIFLDEY